jgi:hypothetical protein
MTAQYTPMSFPPGLPFCFHRPKELLPVMFRPPPGYTSAKSTTI